MNDTPRARTLQIIDMHDRDPASLIAILQDVQVENSYLSQENLELIAAELNLGIAKVFGVATFFENFSLEAKGKRIVKVCKRHGTSCPQIPADLRRRSRASEADRQAENVQRRPVHARDRCMPRRVRSGPGHDHRRRGPRENGPGQGRRSARRDPCKGGGC